MKIEQVGLQLFTLREFLKTPEDIAATLKKVRAIGYESVQVSGMGPIPEKDLVAICGDLGLTICATHEKGGNILDNPAAVVERLGQLNCKLTAYPFPAGLDFTDPAVVRNLIDQLDAAGEVLHRAGQVLMYHNHAQEFLRIDGQLLLDKIFAETKPQHLQAELDTYWIQYGGANPVTWCAKMKNRLPLLHLKDYAIEAPNKPVFAEIGYGQLDWPAIISAAEEAGCAWFVVEQDVCPGDPFESSRKSFDYIKDNLVEQN